MPKISILPLEEEYTPIYECKKCGCNLCSVPSLTEHKFGGPGLHAPTVKVCENCRNASDFAF